MEFKELIYKLKALNHEGKNNLEYCYSIFELLLKINYNLMIEEELELLETLKEIGCDNFDLWFENSQSLEVFYAVYYIRSLMSGLGKNETNEVYSDLFPITSKNINNWHEETRQILKK